MSKCDETAGFLIAAPCKRQAVAKCDQCKKGVCEKHQRKGAMGQKIYCITCYRKSGAKYTEENDDPYLDSGYYYNDYYESSYYQDDWEGSEVILADGYDDGEWEGDFDGS